MNVVELFNQIDDMYARLDTLRRSYPGDYVQFDKVRDVIRVFELAVLAEIDREAEALAGK